MHRAQVLLLLWTAGLPSVCHGLDLDLATSDWEHINSHRWLIAELAPNVRAEGLEV
ncbi:MAG TPA: hypothetical protein VEV17_16710 [Bryobacteraceae bacterium]|nr:hypothetical protein [Bryobacteraceae bacterium]